ncbi:autotransporter assembly complex protein TamA [Moraxella catarrhalis]|uniref:Outer membrane protein n=1 Tax=Moraxella catarrhalis TaxID=480 RepID=A0A198UG43_MORCA|nr:BamA/TamA family outer membrane protein [Moraxella catarrhalis]OAU95003.1 Outer membrane protein [Moraxella catarrhalis]OAU95391.1 Outer membrane protein [Moraxella catarrhalis]OAU98227.1 Outer membrane protein [Moraxella catarrhalis]
MSKSVLLTNRIFAPVSLAACLPFVMMQALAQQIDSDTILTTHAAAQDAADQVVADVPMPALLTPEQIQARLNAASLNTPVRPQALDAVNVDHQAPVSRIGDQSPPLGLDMVAIKETTPISSEELFAQESDETGINPEDYIPEYQGEQPDTDVIVPQTLEPEQPGLIKRLYARLFNDGVSKAPRLKATFYQSSQSGEITAIQSSDQKTEPYANIKAALEDVTQESVMDLSGSIARLRQTALAAARAVGYYDIDLSIIRNSVGEVDVVIYSLGEPVRIDYRAVEVRGEGADDASFAEVSDEVPLQAGDVFHHGQYETKKYLIENTSAEHGYFDGRWLDHSVDVILPDNIADVSLIYDTGTQYRFDEVVFFTIDPKTNQLTTDPDKLPVKRKLLEQLLTFDMGEAYNLQAVRTLSNDLLATRYFNMVNTEIVFPEREQTQNDQVSFERSSGSRAEQGQVDDSTLEPVIETVELADGTLVDISPIEFSTSSLIQDKLDLVTAKARRLHEMPDDRVLAINNDDRINRSILGRISDAVSAVARAILPDESESDAIDLPERAALANRKTPADVYQSKKVPLYVFVASDKPRDAQIGVGWGSDTGTRVVTKFEHNLVNRDGYQAGAELRLSEDKKGVKLYATRPLSHPLNDKLRASLGYEEEVFGQSTNGFDLSSRTLEQGISRNIIQPGGWNRTYSLRYRLDELETQAPPDTWQDLPVNFVGGKPTQEALLAGVAVHKTVADDPVNPMRGYRQQYSLEVGSDSVVSDANMAIVRAGISGVYSFGDNAYGSNRAHQLIGGLQAGYIWSDNFNHVPYRLRFFAGGDQSIRGYAHDSLSPVSDKGYLTGGQVLAVGTAEYNYEFMKDLRLAVFSDIGNAYDKGFNNDTKIGAGVGVRWASPVGQVRVDVATGVKEEGNPIKLHFFIGTPF